MPAKWKTLPLNIDSIPQLLVKADLHTTGYTIQLTDLSQIWGETLTKRDIKKRALNDDCSIDPSDGDDQYTILLEKVQQALDQSDGATLSLRSTPSQQADGLLLTLSAPLPAPLSPFTWTIHLVPLPPTSIETQLVTPLLHQAITLQSQAQQLIQELHAKDRVISKITDALERSGNDITTVFPGVANVKLKGRKSQREQLARHVRGLGDFDEEGWRKKTGEGVEGGGRVEDGVLCGVLGGLVVAADGERGVDGEEGEWWRGLEGRTAKGQASAPVPGGEGKDRRHDSQRSANGGNDLPLRSAADENEDVTMQDDELDNDFQRQGTPPHLRHHTPEPAEDNNTQRIESSMTQERAAPPPPPAAPVDDESTTEEDDDDDLDAAPRKPQRLDSSMPARQRTQTQTPDTTAAASPARKLGAIGGRRPHQSSSSPPSPPPAKEPSPSKQTSPSPPKPRSKLGAIGGKPKAKTSPSPTPTPEPEAEAEEASPRPTPKPTRAKLGAIGGRKAKHPSTASAATAEPPAPLSPKQSDHTATAPSSAKRSHKLGTIGGSHAQSSTQRPPPQRSEDDDPSPSSTREVSPRRSRQLEREAVTPAPPRETSRERADRKRGELKRQLEDKAKAGVRKKKRVF